MAGVPIAYSRRAIWGQVRSSVAHANQTLNDLHLPVGNLLYRRAQSLCQNNILLRDVLSGYYILFLCRKKPSLALAFSFGAASVFVTRGLFSLAARSAFYGQTLAWIAERRRDLGGVIEDFIGWLPENIAGFVRNQQQGVRGFLENWQGARDNLTQFLGKINFKTFVSWFELSQNFLKYQIHSHEARSKALTAEIEDPEKGLTKLAADADKVADGTYNLDEHVHPVRLAAGIEDTQAPAKDQAPAWKEAIEQKIAEKRSELQKLQEQIETLQSELNPDLDTCCIEDIAVVTLALYIGIKVPIFGYVVEAVAAIGCLILGGLAGSNEYRFATQELQ